MRRLARHFGGIPHSGRASFAIIGCSLMTSALNMAFPLVYYAIFNRFIPTQDMDLLRKTVVCGFALSVFVVLYYFLMDHLVIGLRIAVTREMRERLTADVLGFRAEFFRKRAVGEIVQALIPDVDTLATTLARACCISGALLEMALLALLLALLCRPALWAYAGFAAASLGWSFLLKQAIVERKNALASVSGRVYDGFFQVLLGIKHIKSMNLEERQIALVARELSRARLDSLRVAAFDSALASAPAFLFRAAFVAGLVLAYLALRDGSIQTGSFICALALLYKMGRPFDELASHAGLLNSGISASGRLARLGPAHAERSGPTRFAGLESGIEFRGVSFAYGPGKPALQGVDLAIPRGADIAIVGESGSGKSSLIRLLLRIQDASEGSVLINGRPIAEYEIRSLREKIGVVSQDVFLFNDTIRKNIDYGGRLGDAELAEVCRVCRLEELIGKAKGGWDARIGERGGLVSGGERQRIAIARLIAREADVLIFDEASSALDPRVERQIREMVLEYRGLRPGVTSITISHRAGAIQSSDRVFVMHGGRIVESGDAEELLGGTGHFSRLFAEGHKRAETVAPGR